MWIWTSTSLFPHFHCCRRSDGSAIQNALYQMTGRSTVPNVFIRGKSIGGGDDTERLYKNGQLKVMVEGL